MEGFGLEGWQFIAALLMAVAVGAFIGWGYMYEGPKPADEGERRRSTRRSGSTERTDFGNLDPEVKKRWSKKIWDEGLDQLFWDSGGTMDPKMSPVPQGALETALRMLDEELARSRALLVSHNILATGMLEIQRTCRQMGFDLEGRKRTPRVRWELFLAEVELAAKIYSEEAARASVGDGGQDDGRDRGGFPNVDERAAGDLGASDHRSGPEAEPARDGAVRRQRDAKRKGGSGGGGARAPKRPRDQDQERTGSS